MTSNCFYWCVFRRKRVENSEQTKERCVRYRFNIHIRKVSFRKKSMLFYNFVVHYMPALSPFGICQKSKNLAQ